MASKEADTDVTGEKAGPSTLLRSANTAVQETYIVTGKETEVQRALRKKYCEIRDHATVKKVLPYLYQKSVISQEEKQNIEKALENQGNINACGQLIDKVMLKGDKCIKTFISLLPESLQKAFDEELKHPTSDAETAVQRALLKIYDDITEKTKVTEVLVKVFEKNIVSQEEKENVQAKLKTHGEITSCKTLVDIILKKEDRMIEGFVKQLRPVLQDSFTAELKNLTSLVGPAQVQSASGITTGLGPEKTSKEVIDEDAQYILLVTKQWAFTKPLDNLALTNRMLAQILHRIPSLNILLCCTDETEFSKTSRADANKCGIAKLLHREELGELNVSHIIGYAPGTFKDAVAIQKEKYPDASVIFINCDIPTDKPHFLRNDASEMDQLEGQITELAADVKAVFSLGYKIYDHFEDLFSDIKEKHKLLLPMAVNTSLPEKRKNLSDAKKVQIVTFGPVENEEDFYWKGLHVIKDSISKIIKAKEDLDDTPPVWNVTGINWEQLKDKFEQSTLIYHKDCATMKLFQSMFKSATVCLFSSQMESLQMVGLDCIAAGVPMLVASESGLAQLIKQVTGTLLDTSSLIVDTSRNKTGSEEEDAASWKKKLNCVLKNPKEIRGQVEKLHQILCESVAVHNTHTELWQSCGVDTINLHVQPIGVARSAQQNPSIQPEDTFVIEQNSEELQAIGNDMGDRGMDILNHVTGSFRVLLTEYVKGSDKQKREEALEALLLVQSLQNTGSKLMTIKSGSVIFTMHCPTVAALELFWTQYTSGKLKHIMENYLITRSMLRKYHARAIVLKTTVPKEEYDQCRKELLSRKDGSSLDSYERYTRLADDCIENGETKKALMFYSKAIVAYRGTHLCQQSNDDEVTANEILAELFLKCSKAWFTLYSFEESTTNVDISLDLCPTPEAYEHRAQVMKFFDHKDEALKNYMDVLMSHDLAEDNNEQMFISVVYESCCLIYETKAYKVYERFHETHLSATLWQNVIHRLTREGKWAILYRLFKHYSFSDTRLELKDDYSPLLQKDGKYVANLLLHLFQQGVEIRQLFPPTMKMTDILVKILELKGCSTDLFKLASEKLLRKPEEKHVTSTNGDTALHTFCRMETVKWNFLVILLDCGVSPWVFNKEFQLPHQLIDSNSITRSSFKRFLKDKYAKQFQTKESSEVTAQVTHACIVSLLKEASESPACLRKAVTALLQYTSENCESAEPSLFKLSCGYVMVWISMLDILDTKPTDDSLIVPQTCLNEALHELIGRGEWKAVYSLISQNVLSGVQLNKLNLAECIEFLMKHGQPSQNIILSYLEIFTKCQANVNGTNPRNPPLVVAVEKGLVTSALFLVEHGAKLAAEDSEGKTVPLIHKITDLAITSGNLQILEKCIEKHGEHIIQEKDSAGNTLLHHVARKSLSPRVESVMKLLCDYTYVDPYIKNDAGEMPQRLVGRKSDGRMTHLAAARARYVSLNPRARRSHRKRRWLLELEDLPRKTYERIPSAEDETIKLERVIDPLAGFVSDTEKHKFVSNMQARIKATKDILPLEKEDQQIDPTKNNSDKCEKVLPIRLTEFKKLPYELQMAGHFVTTLKQLSKNDRRCCESLISVLGELGKNPKNLKNKTQQSDDIYSSQLLESMHLLWMIAIEFSERHTDKEIRYAQQIRCLDVSDGDQMSGHVERIQTSISLGKRYKFLKFLHPISLASLSESGSVPSIYEISKEHKNGTTTPISTFEENSVTVQKDYPLVTEYLHELLQEANADIDVPFTASAKEHRIIHGDFNTATLLLGRSGTGKTTCCFRKLWERFITYWRKSALSGFKPNELRKRKYKRKNIDEQEEGFSEEDVSYDHLKQVFVTKNAILVSEVEKVFKGYCHTFKYVTQKRNECEQKELPASLLDVLPERFPLILTSRQLLMLLDASLPGEGFFYNEFGAEKYRVDGWTQDGHLEVLIEMMEDLDDFNDLPLNEEAPKEVTPDYFEIAVWPKIREKKSLGGIHPSLIWTEIISFIKGSDEAMKCEKGYLGLARYKEIGRKQAVFGEEERDDVYAIFEQYQRFAKARNLFDITDIVFQLHRRLDDDFLNHWMLHELYVDEAQDFTQAELSLYLKLCQDPNQVFLTGDTAQTIMRGVTFRFQELTTLFHSLSKELFPCRSSAPIKIPKVKHLVENYRSHEGILRLASATVTLMRFYFPQSFDASLPPDVGAMPGPKPIILESTTPENLAIMLRGNSKTVSQIDFGANQAILVVNDRARDTIPNTLQAGIVLTIYEAKGLEFEDVLLYNFFQDSSCTASDWDVIRGDSAEILNILKTGLSEEAMDDTVDIDFQEEENKTAKMKPPPNFDSKKHKILNTDLKYLYTAITRAKRKLWIYDEDKEKHKPIYSLFKQSGLAEFVTVVDDVPDQLFAHATTASEWEEQGDFFLKRKIYSIAKTCYQKANAIEKRHAVDAYVKIEDIQRSERPPRVKCEEYIKAGELFLKAGKYEPAAKCLYNGKEFTLAAELWRKMGQYGLAGNVYSKKLRNYKEAADCYMRDKNYREAIEILTKIKDYNGAAALLQQFKALPADVQDQITERGFSPKDNHTLDWIGFQAAVKCYTAKDFVAMKKALEAYLDYDTKVAFLLNRQRYNEALEIMEKEGKLKEAAENARLHGNIRKAIEYSEKVDGMKIFEVECLLTMMRNAAYRQEEIGDEQMKRADRHLKDLNSLSSAYGAELMMMCGIMRKDIALINDARRKYKLDCKGYTMGAIHCTEWLLKLGNNDITQVSQCTVLSESIGFIMEVASALTTKANNLAEEEAKNCKQFYGITTRVRSDTCEIDIKENPRLDVIVESLKHKGDVQWDEKGHLLVQLQLVEEGIINSLIDMAENWCKKADAYLKGQFKKLVKCETFAAGFECKQADCIHRNYDKETHGALLTTVCLFHRLERSVNKGLSLSISFKFRERISNMLSEKMFTSCSMLWNILFPSPYHEWASTSSVSLAFKMMKQLRHEEVVTHMNDYVTNLWEKASQQQKQSDIGLFIKVWWLYQMMNRNPSKIRHHLRALEKNYQKKVAYQDYKERIPRHVGMLYARNGTYQSIMNIFMNSSKMLYVNCDPVGALNRFVSLVIRRDRKALFPPKGIIMPYMEFMTVVTMAFILKFEMHVKGTMIFLPSSYLALINFFDLVFLDDHWRAKCYDSIQFYIEWYLGYTHVPLHFAEENVRRRLLPGLRRTFTELVDVLLGAVNPNYNILDFSAEDLKSGTAERVVVFLLIVLLNREQCDLPLSLESLIRTKLHGVNCVPGMSDRFKLLLDNVQRNDEGLRGICRVLNRYFYQRNNEYLRSCSWRYDKQVKGIWYRPLHLSNEFKDVPTYFYSYMPLPQPGPRTDFRRQESMAEQRDTMEQEDIQLDSYEEVSDTISNTETQREALKVIVRFLRLVVMKKRLSRFKPTEHIQQSETHSLEAQYNVDDTMCKICGKVFIVRTVEDKEDILEEAEENEVLDDADFPQDVDIDTRKTAEYTENESEKNRSVQLRLEHVSSPEHKENEASFKIFCQYYETKVTRKLQDCREAVANMTSENEYDLLQLQKAKTALEEETERLKRTLRWQDLESVKQAVKQLSVTLAKVQERIAQDPEDESLMTEDNELMPSVLQV